MIGKIISDFWVGHPSYTFMNNSYIYVRWRDLDNDEIFKVSIFISNSNVGWIYLDPTNRHILTYKINDDVVIDAFIDYIEQNFNLTLLK